MNAIHFSMAQRESLSIRQPTDMEYLSVLRASLLCLEVLKALLP